MSEQNQFPLDMVKAGLELNVRIAKLMHESTQRWLDLTQRMGCEDIEECQEELRNLWQTDNWQRLAVLPGEAFWRQLQKRFTGNQSAIEIGIEVQADFNEGLRKALCEWQDAANGVQPHAALKSEACELPFTEFFKGWFPMWPAEVAAAPAAPGKAAPAARKGAAHVH
jgi:hypothetical protein